MNEIPLKIQKRRTVLDFIIQQPLGFIGLIMIIIMFAAAIFAPHVAPFNPEDVDFEALPALGGVQPSWEHFVGADSFGRVFVSRFMYGARRAL